MPAQGPMILRYHESGEARKALLGARYDSIEHMHKSCCTYGCPEHFRRIHGTLFTWLYDIVSISCKVDLAASRH